MDNSGIKNMEYVTTYKTIQICIFISLLFFVIHFIPAAGGREALSNDDYTENSKLIIAHRGASGYLPEHSMEAYAMAYAMGAHYLEPDLVLTKDGVPIALHDKELDTMTNVAEVFPKRARQNGRWYAIDFTLDEIKQLKMHERVEFDSWKQRYSDRFPAEKALFEVATLEEVIELVQGLNQVTGREVGIYPEIKFYEFHKKHGYDFPKILLNILSDYGYKDREAPVFIQAFHPEPLQQLRFELKTELALVQLIGGDNWVSLKDKEMPLSYREMMTPAGLDFIAEYADGIGPWIPFILGHNGRQGSPVVNRNLVTDAHERGLLVHVYTVRKDDLPRYVDNIQEYLEVLYFEVGVDGVFIDHPDYAEALLR